MSKWKHSTDKLWTLFPNSAKRLLKLPERYQDQKILDQLTTSKVLATGKATAWMMHLTLYLNGSSCFSQFITLWPVSFCPQAIVYVSQEWMTDDRLPLWNVHNVRISTNDNLELWHNELNKKAGKSHVKDFASGCLRRVYQIYFEMQRRVVVYTSECTSGRRLLEQYLEVSAVSEDLMYLIPEVI
ncbi:hypothetical protein T4C_4194 [Trichinella pseudospiralis]|uniref:Uncharacterized protein n=1 Tax=Trichinella pseudospiralis TaxID=6337 RepID=A0A0V1J7M2_TRIPS|nr:hypothetical protein T4C_4194 [Trichinella pseudospiralis]